MSRMAVARIGWDRTKRMFERLKAHWKRRRSNAALVETLLEGIAAAARAPALYTRLGVADTVWGRFEMMALHVFLFEHRAKSGGEALRAMAQELVDAYFHELDSTLRELGIGDASVPKRMKKLGRMVYGRWQAYGAALDAGDRDAMAEALRRNVYAEGGDPEGAAELAAYVDRSFAHLGTIDDAALLRGRIAFPDPTALEAA